MYSHPAYLVRTPPAISPTVAPAGAEPAPDPERLVALGALGEHVHHDRQGGGQHHRCSDALDRPGSDHEAGTRSAREWHSSSVIPPNLVA